MRRLLPVLVCLLAAATGFVAQAYGQTLRIALREDPDILDPTLARTYVGRVVFAGLCDKLFDLDETLRIVPQLAIGFQWSDTRTLLIHLRTDVSFQDGEKLDAAAVKYSLERHLTLQGSFRRSEIASIDHVDIVDPANVRLVLKTPSAPLLSQLTDRAGMILPPHATEAAGKDFGLHPVCSGPFGFVERVAQDRIVLDRFPGYWNAAAIHFDRVIYRTMPDSSVQLANLQSGAIDLAERVLPSDVAAVKRDRKLRIVTSPALGYEGITFNLGNGARSQAAIDRSTLLRQAFDAAIDRQALDNVVFNGMYHPTAQAVSAASPYYTAALPPPPRDLDRARALVRQSGVPTPVSVTLNVPNTPDRTQEAEVIQALVREAGFDVKLNVVEFASSLQMATEGDFEAYLIGWSGRADPDGNLYAFLHSDSGQNDGHYANPLVDETLEDARRTNDVDARKLLYAATLAQVREDMPIIYLENPVNIEGMSARLSGFRPVPDGIIRLQGMEMAPP